MDLSESELEATLKMHNCYSKCYHCGKNEQHYCEKCFQELIAENLRLQTNFNSTENEHNLLYKILLLIYELEAQSESKKAVGYEVREFLHKFHKLYNKYRAENLIKQNKEREWDGKRLYSRIYIIWGKIQWF